jgi:hypothetical protein
LADVREDVSNWPLKQPLYRHAQLFARREIRVKKLECGKELALLLRLGAGLRIMPKWVARGRAECQVQQVAHIGQDLSWLAAGTVKGRNAFPRVFKDPGSSISQCRQAVTEEFTVRIRAGKLYRKRASERLVTGASSLINLRF